MKKKVMQEHLLKEWDYEANSGVDPLKLPRSSNYEAVWNCDVCGGLWQTAVKNRTAGSGCPYCAGRKVLHGFNDLWTTHPEIASQWVWADDGKTPAAVTKGSHTVVEWQCEEGHHWKAVIKTRVAGYGCPYCSGREAVPGENSLDVLNPELLDEWDYERNGSLRPSMITPSSNKKVWWTCKVCGYGWKTDPAHRTREDRDKKRGCPCCNHKAVVPGINDAATYNPEVAKDWDDELNGKPLNTFLPASNKRGWWTCHTCGMTWEAQVQSRVVGGKSCPFCAGKRPIPGMTDLFTLRPELAKEWNYEKNGNLTPHDVTEFSSKRIWWACGICGYEWKATVANRSDGRGCPHCAPNRRE